MSISSREVQNVQCKPVVTDDYIHLRRSGSYSVQRIVAFVEGTFHAHSEEVFGLGPEQMVGSDSYCESVDKESKVRISGGSQDASWCVFSARRGSA